MKDYRTWWRIEYDSSKGILNKTLLYDINLSNVIGWSGINLEWQQGGDPVVHTDPMREQLWAEREGLA